MNRYVPLAVLTFSLLWGGCADRSTDATPLETEVKDATPKVPNTFNGALNALDEMASEEDKQAYRNDEVNMSLVHRQIGMRLRNDWGLWSGSNLKDYFSERGIAHADWISSAIFEAWIERLKTGSVDEDAVIAKYAKIEREWRTQYENTVWKDTDGDGWMEAFPREQAEQNAAEQPASRPAVTNK